MSWMTSRQRQFILGSVFLIVLLLALSLWVWFSRVDSIEETQFILLDAIEVPMATFIELDDTSAEVLEMVRSLEAELSLHIDSMDVSLLNHATLAFIRNERYGFNSDTITRVLWGRFAGTIEEECDIDFTIPDVKALYKTALEISSDIAKGRFNDPLSENEIDFVHMIAVIDLYVSARFEREYEERYYDALFSWGGDLETFLIDMARCAGDDYEDFIEHYLATERESHFSVSDFLADIDGVNIAFGLSSGKLLSDMIEEYYISGSVLKRRADFVKNMGGMDVFSSMVKGVLLEEIEPHYIGNSDFEEFMKGFSGVRHLLLKHVAKEDLPITHSMRRILAEKFLELFK
jgi:hypothetical protein